MQFKPNFFKNMRNTTFAICYYYMLCFFKKCKKTLVKNMLNGVGFATFVIVMVE